MRRGGGCHFATREGEWKLMGRPLCVKEKVDGKERKGQSRGQGCLGRGCRMGAPMDRNRSRGIATSTADPNVWGVPGGPSGSNKSDVRLNVSDT